MMVNGRDMMLLPQRHLNTSEMQTVWNGGWKNELVAAASKGDLDQVAILLPKTMNREYRELALEEATHHEHEEIVHYLLRRGVRNQAAFVRACGRAVAAGSPPIILLAFSAHCRIDDGCIVGVFVGLSKSKPRASSSWRKDVWTSPLRWACRQGNAPGVRFLLDRNAIVREEDIAAANESGDGELVQIMGQKKRSLPI